jgi:hypothetical protein
MAGTCTGRRERGGVVRPSVWDSLPGDHRHSVSGGERGQLVVLSL